MATAKEFLDSMLTVEKQLKMKNAQIEHLRDSLSNLTAPTDKEFVSSTKDVTIMAKTIACIVDLEKEVNAQTASLVAQRIVLYRLLDQMNPEQAMIIVSRFVEGKTVKAVSQSHHLSMRQAFRKVTESVEQLQKLMDQR